MNRIQKTLLGLATVLAFWGCKKQLTESEEGTKLTKPAIEFSTAQGGRLSTASRGVLEMQLANKNGRTAATIVSNPYPINQVGQVAAPVVNGNATVARTVAMANANAYVGYRRKNGDFAGAIDIINVSNPAVPTLVQTAAFTHTDIHVVKLSGTRLYFGGATNISEDRTLTSSGVFGYLELDANGRFTGVSQTFSLPVDIIYDIDFHTDRAFAVGGRSQFTGNTNSAFFEFNITLNRVTVTLGAGNNFFDLRSVAVKKTGYPYMSIYSGFDGIHKYDAIQLNSQAFFPQTKDSLEFNGRGMVYLGENLLVAAGKYGMRYLDGNTYTQLDRIQIPQNLLNVNYNDIASFDVSVSTAGNYIFGAMGAAGVYVSQLQGNDLQLLGSYVFDNEVAYSIEGNATNMVVATSAGVKILEFTVTPQTNSICTGLPIYNGGIDYVLTNGATQGFGGNVGHQTMHIGGTYTHCGNVSVSKNFTITQGRSMTLRGNLFQGFTNSSSHFSIERGAVLTVSGNLTIYGDLMLEGEINFNGASSTLTVLGTVFRGPFSAITGNIANIAGNITPAASFNTQISLVATAPNIPNTAQGVFVHPNGVPMPTGSQMQFTAVFPRNINYMDTVDVSENGIYKFSIHYPHEYRNEAWRYTKSNGVPHTAAFPARPVPMPANPSSTEFFRSFRHSINVPL